MLTLVPSIALIRNKIYNVPVFSTPFSYINFFMGNILGKNINMGPTQ
jgi:hypothetical protein